jgi:Protein of unknown function (DUF732)
MRLDDDEVGKRGEVNTRVLLYLMIIGITMGASVVMCTRSRADTTDDVYVESLHNVGITSLGKGDAGLITMGHIVCNAFGIGESFNDVGTLILSNNPGLNSTGAGQIIGAATAAYCPTFTWKFDGTPPSTSAPRDTGVVA